jgi:DNA (cytosine-5)-methyltransferase 1
VNHFIFRTGHIKFDTKMEASGTFFEAKRIQTFPDDFVIKGAWGEAMRQIGNAVPVILGEIMGRSIIKKLTAYNEVLLRTG